MEHCSPWLMIIVYHSSFFLRSATLEKKFGSIIVHALEIPLIGVEIDGYIYPMPPHQGLTHHVHWALALQHGKCD